MVEDMDLVLNKILKEKRNIVLEKREKGIVQVLLTTVFDFIVV